MILTKPLKRAALYVQMRCLEAVIDGQSECLECVRDPYLINRIIVAQINARNELRRVRRAYNEVRGMSARDGWRIAL